MFIDDVREGQTYAYRAAPGKRMEPARVVGFRLKRRSLGTDTVKHAEVLLPERADPGPWPVLASDLHGPWPEPERKQ